MTEFPALTDREIAADGSTGNYAARRTMGPRVEFARQIRRRRTQITLGFLAILPFVLLIAFQLGSNQQGSRSGGFVDLATASGMNFMIFTMFASMSFLLVVVVALFFGDAIASEASWSTLKYLLAIPIPRGRLMRQKATVSALMTLLGLLVLPVMSLIVGVIWYGAGDAISPTGDSLTLGTGIARGGLMVAYVAIHFLWLAGLAMFLSVSTDAPLGAVGGAVLISIVSQILDTITALEGLRNYLPTHYAFAWSDLLSSEIDWSEMARGALSAVLYGSIFTALAIRRFLRKDITS